MKLLREGAPESMKGFGALAIAATASKALDTKTKELMALAVGIALHCDGCVLFIPKWPPSMEPPVRRLPRRSLSPSTWEVDQRRGWSHT
jgi:hypothetical protein